MFCSLLILLHQDYVRSIEKNYYVKIITKCERLIK